MICETAFYAQSDNIEVIKKFFNEKLPYYNMSDCADDSVEIYFDSEFSKEMMEELFNSIPDKENLYMQCLSVSNDNVECYKCEGSKGWIQIL